MATIPEKHSGFLEHQLSDIPVLGIHSTQEDADTVKVKEVNGIKIAFLDYTYGTNNSGVGDGYEYMLDIFDKDKITTMIQKAKEVSDCIIFVAHWGTEDETMPNEYEKQWAAFLMQQGVDVIIGGHPHVLQPYGQLSDDQGHTTTVFYLWETLFPLSRNSRNFWKEWQALQFRNPL